MQTVLPAPQSCQGLRLFIESGIFRNSIVVLIALNAVTLGLETSDSAMRFAGPLILRFDQAVLWIFTAELALKLWVYRWQFARDPWNLFDFAVVAIAWVPASGPLAILRALRILRVLRILSIVPQMRKVVGALLHSLPGMGSIVAVLLLVFYVAAVMATKLFGTEFDDWFGSIGASMYSLFQIMTLESWSMGIVRPVMDVYPQAWMFFVPFIIVTSFAVLNLFIALVVNSMNNFSDHAADAVHEEAQVAHDERENLKQQLVEISTQLARLESRLDKK